MSTYFLIQHFLSLNFFSVAHDQTRTEDSEDLWTKVEKEHVCKLQGGLPRNAFEEMIRLTEQGKVWTFPVDNEAGQ